MKNAILKYSIKSTKISECLSVFSPVDRKKLLFITVLQASLGTLDLIGVGLIGVLTALGMTGISSRGVGDKIDYVLQMFGIETLNLNKQVALLGVFAALILVTKTIISIKLTRKVLFFLSVRGANLSAQLVRQTLSQSLPELQRRTAQETMFAVSTGVEALTLRVLAPLTAIFSDAFLVLLVSFGLFVIDPRVAIINMLLYSLLGLILNHLLRGRAQNLGLTFARMEVQSNEKVVEILSTFKESFVRNTRDFYGFEIENLRLRMANTAAELGFLPNISKYVIEIAAVFGGLSIAAIQFLTEDAIHAVTGLSLFLAAGSRIAPAVLRIQQNSLTLNAGIGAAEKTLELISQLPDLEPVKNVEMRAKFEHIGFSPSVELKSVNFSYSGKTQFAIEDLSLKISAGEFVAFVGPSGAGKTTLVDLILGLLKADSGEIVISNVKPTEAIKRWPGSIAYVPQEIQIIKGTFAENIALGYPFSDTYFPHMEKAALSASLIDFLENNLHGFETLAGERGLSMSGGQRQRLGIARALFTSPKLIILDEATSSLDSLTENAISNALKNLRGEVTLIVIAHRLSTIINADQVVYMEEGKIIANGSFTEVKKQVPNFAEQARLMGI